MASAMIVDMRPTSSQPQVTATGPPRSNATKYDVRQPARIEMIVKLMAKFWNPPIAAEELLRVAQLVEDLLVLRGVVPAGSGTAAHLTDLPCRFRGANSPTAQAFCQGMSSMIRVSSVCRTE